MKLVDLPTRFSVIPRWPLKVLFNSLSLFFEKELRELGIASWQESHRAPWRLWFGFNENEGSWFNKALGTETNGQTKIFIWWLNQRMNEKYAQVKLDHLPRVSDENSKNIWETTT